MSKLKRKQKLINRDFQLKKTLGVIAGVSIIIAVILISAGIFISMNNSKIDTNNQAIMDNSERMKKILELQQILYINLSIRQNDSTKQLDKETAAAVIRDFNNSVDMLNAAVSSSERLFKSNNEIMKSNNSMLIISVLFFIVGVAILFNRVLEHTHRISGPIFVMSRHIKTILEGGNPEMRDLREKDDFKAFYDLLRELADKHHELRNENAALKLEDPR